MRTKSIALIALASVTLLACSIGSFDPTKIVASFLPTTPTATLAPATATAIPVAINTATVAATQPASIATGAATTTASSSYDGDWRGTSDPNALPLNFTIKNNQVTQANINWSIKVGSCSVGGGFAETPKDSAVTGKTFIAHLTSSGLDFTFQGTFASDSDASGTIEWKGKHEFCGDVPLTQVKWNAHKGNGQVNPPSPTLPRATAPVAATNVRPTATTGAITGAAVTVQTFFATLNQQNLNAALNLVSDDVIYNVGTASGIGKDKLRAYLQSQSNAQYTLSNLRDTGDIVNFSIKVSNNASLSSGSFILSGGKIEILNLR